MLCIISKEKIAFCAQVEGMQGEIISTSHIALECRRNGVPNEPIPTYGHSWPQRQTVHSK